MTWEFMLALKSILWRNIITLFPCHLLFSIFPVLYFQNIERRKVYKVSLHIMSSDAVSLTVSLTSSDGQQKTSCSYHHVILFYLLSLVCMHVYLCTIYMSFQHCAFRGCKKAFANWTKIEFHLKSSRNNTNSRLQLTTNKRGVIWLDQVSVMPLDTYMVYYITHFFFFWENLEGEFFFSHLFK
jgi:hypothetical protein